MAKVGFKKGSLGSPFQLEYYTDTIAKLNDLGSETWDSLKLGPCGFNVAVGQNAGWSMRESRLCVFFGHGVGSDVTDATGLVLMKLPNGRLFRADLVNETAEFLDYSDDAARVAPEFRSTAKS